MKTLETIVKHGMYAAAKWAGHPSERPYWEARYAGLQCLYAEIANNATAYADFNAKCGITFTGGHITSASLSDA